MHSIFRKLPKDILFKTALELDLSDILSLCETDEKINDKLCIDDNPYFWIEKLQKDFYVDYNNLQTILDPKKLYFKLSKNFDYKMNELFTTGYPYKLINFLIKYGYIKEFKNEISKLLGPYYGKKIDDEEIYWGIKDRVYDITEKYFFYGDDYSFYPLRDFDFIDTFKIDF